jgi:hypothetical protein
VSGMRYLLPIVLPLVASGLGGCAEECPPPDFALNGKTWNVVNTVVAIEPPTLDPAFPGESSPANGPHVMSITWESVQPTSGVTVAIDGQEFRGQGAWDDAECGNFTVTFEGEYVSADGRATHDFTAGAALQTWEGHLEGTWDYAEIWRKGGASGRVDFSVQTVGTP